MQKAAVYKKKKPLKGHYMNGQFFEFEAVTKNKRVTGNMGTVCSHISCK